MAPLHQRYVSIMVAVLKFHYRKELFYVLRGKDDRIFLLISNRLCSGCGASSGNALSVACIGPGNAWRDLQYELEVKGGKANTPILKGSPENARKWSADYLPRFSLYVSNEPVGWFGWDHWCECLYPRGLIHFIVDLLLAPSFLTCVFVLFCVVYMQKARDQMIQIWTFNTTLISA